MSSFSPDRTPTINSPMMPNEHKKDFGFHSTRQKVRDDEGNYVIKSPYLTDEKSNPCIKEQNLTTKCMYENNYAQEKCILTFDNYTECRRFWKFVSWDRWANGEIPHLPPPEERERVKKEYLHKWMKKSNY